MKIFTIIITALLLMNFACNSTKKTTETTITEQPIINKSEIVETKKTVEEVVDNATTANAAIKKTSANTTLPTKDNNEIDIDMNGNSTQTDATNPLIGEYVWVKTICCGRLRNVTTPQTETERVLQFNTNGKMVKIENNSRAAERNYTYYENGKIYPGRPQLKIEGKNQDALVRYEDGMLVLDYQYMDLQLEYYKKVK